MTAGLTGRDPNVKVNVLRCSLRTKSSTLICIYGDCNAILGFITGAPHKQCVCLCSKYMYGRILRSLNIVKLYREMFKLKLKINVKVPQLLYMAVAIALNGESERFGGFCVGCCYML